MTLPDKFMILPISSTVFLVTLTVDSNCQQNWLPIRYIKGVIRIITTMKKIGLGAVIVAGILLAGWLYYNKPHRSVTESDFLTVQATDLFAAYQNNEEQANHQYLNKVLGGKGSCK